MIIIIWIISHTKIITIICANAQHLANKIEHINIKIKKKNKHPHNPWVNHFVNEYCTKFFIFGECDCFSLDYNII
jgi:hypothetical protein